MYYFNVNYFEYIYEWANYELTYHLENHKEINTIEKRKVAQW